MACELLKCISMLQLVKFPRLPMIVSQDKKEKNQLYLFTCPENVKMSTYFLAYAAYQFDRQNGHSKVSHPFQPDCIPYNGPRFNVGTEWTYSST